MRWSNLWPRAGVPRICVISVTKYLALTIVAVVALALAFATFFVIYTGSTDGLAEVGQMLAQIIKAFVR
jgi:hypothetical protein